MMIDPIEAGKLLRHRLQTMTLEEFESIAREYSPELLNWTQRQESAGTLAKLPMNHHRDPRPVARSPFEVQRAMRGFARRYPSAARG